MNFRRVNVPKVPTAGSVSKVIALLALGGGGLYAATNSLFNVEGGHRAIVFNRIHGIKDKVYPEGTHLMIPWIERPVIYDVRARPHLVESTSGSRDLQMVKIGLRVLTRPYADQLPTIYRTLGENYNDGQCTMDNYIMPAFSVVLFVSHGYWKPSMLKLDLHDDEVSLQKVMLKLDLHDDKAKQKAMKAVSTLSGIDFIRMDMKEQKLTVIGSVDPVDVVSKLRKNWHAEIFSVGPAKEPEKKEEPKKEEPKKEVEKKDASDQMVSDLVKAYQAYNPQMTTYYYVQSAEENPNSCVIC